MESISLIASSIMSKKIASGADALVLDVKMGKGAFMKDLDSSKELSRKMINIGTLAGLKTIAIITNIKQKYIDFKVRNTNCDIWNCRSSNRCNYCK